MNLGRWQHIAKTYTKLGMLKPDFNFTGFLYDPNPPPRDLRWLYALIGAGALVIVIVSALTVYIYRTNVRLKQEAANRKQAEEAIRESEKKYRLVVDNMTDVITVMDMNLRFTYVSPSIMRLRGYTPEEAMAQTLEQMMTPESQQIVVKAFEEEMALETSGSADPGRSRILELEEYRKDGSIVWSEDHLSFVRDEAQKAVGIISLTRDITERKRAEAVLRESEERYRSLFENANEAIFVAQDGRLVFLNPMTSRLIGYSSEELMGRSFLDFIHPDDQNMVIENYLKRLKGEDFQTRYTFRYLAKNGAIRWMEIGAVLIKWDGRPATLNFCTDITEQKHAAEKIRQLAYHDSLTGLPNRKLFSDRLGIALAQARRNQKDVAVTMLDLDHFKDVNDTLGHDVGDLLLKSAAERLSAALRKGDTVARFGGDEFVLILPDLKGTEDAVQVAQKIVESFRKPFLIDTHQLIVTTSIGITVCPNDGTDENMLLKNADIAMYQAKQAGRDRYQIYKEG
jgi:diguanylate cyclase (GGDEF)-like protein/PAS domain S-box-containing protein